MKNTTKIKVPQYLQYMVEEIYSDSDKGYWCFSKKGYHFSDMDFGVHIVREDTQKLLIDMIKSLEPCDCDDCKM